MTAKPSRGRTAPWWRTRAGRPGNTVWSPPRGISVIAIVTRDPIIRSRKPDRVCCVFQRKIRFRMNLSDASNDRSEVFFKLLVVLPGVSRVASPNRTLCQHCFGYVPNRWFCRGLWGRNYRRRFGRRCRRNFRWHGGGREGFGRFLRRRNGGARRNVAGAPNQPNRKDQNQCKDQFAVHLDLLSPLGDIV